MAYKITLIPGDGTGPEISQATKRCVDATGVKIDWEIVNAGVDIMEKEGTPLPGNVVESIRKNKINRKSEIKIGKEIREK